MWFTHGPEKSGQTFIVLSLRISINSRSGIESNCWQKSLTVFSIERTFDIMKMRER